MRNALPPGQIERADFPRFGLTPYAKRFPHDTADATLRILGDVERELTLNDALRRLPRVELTTDFHCVTTWSKRQLTWSGIRFADFHRAIVVPEANPRADATYVLMKAQDGYRTSLPLEDLLNPEVLLADRLDGQPLDIAHGAPLRLIAPAHYGYKSVKHIDRIGYWTDARAYRPPLLRFLDHPRARVVHEERGRGFPGALLRYVYRPLIASNVVRFERALARHLQGAAR